MRKNEDEKKKPVKISTNGSEIVKDIMKNQRVSMVQIALITIPIRLFTADFKMIT